MKCLHPRIIKYTDIMGVEHFQEIPCNHCIACLHNQQDSWSIRLLETNNAHTSFIYDTLTFSPSGISYRNISDKALRVISNCSSPQDRLKLEKLLDRYRCVDPDSGELMYLAPYVDRSILQNWIKRGRELFRYRYGRRLNLKYFIVYENGPKTSRCHYHLLMWGISYEDYITFFAKPWRRSMGFTKTKFIFKGTDKDRQCIARYLSKYVSKGVFESPLVRYNLIPKPYRSISHGIGEEFLNRKCFDWFRSDFARYLKKHSVDLSERHDELSFRSKLRAFIASPAYKQIYPRIIEHLKQCSYNLTTYYDSNGFAHSLPRYYRDKLFNSKVPNILSYVAQEYLLESARVYHNKELQEFAHSLGYLVADKSPQDSFAGFGRELFNILDHKFDLTKRLQAKIEAKGRFIKLKNHYGRAMNLNYAYCN